MLQKTKQHTTFYCDVFLRQDVILPNDLVTRGQRAKPKLHVNSKPATKYPWNPTVRLCNPDNTCIAFPTELSYRIFHSPMLHLRTIKSINRDPTYIATSIEHEICVFRFGQVDWAVREARDLAASFLPYELRGFVHQKLSKRFARACQVEEVDRVDACGDLFHRVCQEKRLKKMSSHTRNSTSRFS